MQKETTETRLREKLPWLYGMMYRPQYKSEEEIPRFLDVEQEFLAFLSSEIKLAKEEVIKEWRPSLYEVIEALADMYWQYCGDNYGHAFMSAGERASYILEKYRHYKFDEAGRITHEFVRENKDTERHKGKWKKVSLPKEGK